MEFITVIDMSALNLAVKTGNVEIVKLLMAQPNIDINRPTIQNHVFQ